MLAMLSRARRGFLLCCILILATRSSLVVGDTPGSCMQDIGDPMVCPDPIPTFESCYDPAPNCTVAVVGAAAGGIYTSMRLVDNGTVPANEICIFEMTNRVGGRIYSMRGFGPDNDLVIDIGGYRTWPTFTPTMQALITEYLGHPMECYDDSNPCDKYNLVDENGFKNGMATWLEEALQNLIDQGACWYPNHKLLKLEKVATPGVEISRRASSLPTKLYFENGVEATASWATIVNTPQRPLLEIVRNSNFDEQNIMDEEKLEALHSVQTTISTKLYLYYPKGHTFWLRLGLTSGDYEYPGDAQNMLLAGRYSDGDVRCDDPEDPATCHGFLLAVYATDFSGNKAQYFRRFQRKREEVVTFITQDDLEGRVFLKHAHDRLVEYHRQGIRDPPYTGFQLQTVLDQTDPPLFAVLGNWGTDIPGIGGAYHGWTNVDKMALAIEPFVENDIYVVTEAYSTLHGWIEGTIKVADQVLEKYLDTPRPWNFPVVDIEQHNRPTDSNVCGSDGHGSSSSSAGATAEGGEPIAYFDVTQHSEEEDCWSIIHGDVYELTEFINTHSGPSGPIKRICGIDGTASFASHHDQGLLGKIAQHRMAPAEFVPMSDVELHATEDDCWTVINDVVYDFTTFEHSGPSGPIVAVCGVDGTDAYMGKHGGTNMTEVLLERIAASIVGPHGTNVESTAAGAGAAAAVDPFCFTADALVEMADGTFKAIIDVKEGDYVSTGTELGQGLVTEKLIHPMEKTVAVAIVETDFGPLVGTPSHPMLHKGDWIELGDLIKEEDVAGTIVLTEQHVDAFYNLEIDGHSLASKTGEMSSHSYVVNGMVASGLGDNEDLNLLYPRQDVWKNLV